MTTVGKSFKGFSLVKREIAIGEKLAAVDDPFFIKVQHHQIRVASYADGSFLWVDSEDFGGVGRGPGQNGLKGNAPLVISFGQDG